MKTNLSTRATLVGIFLLGAASSLQAAVLVNYSSNNLNATSSVTGTATIPEPSTFALFAGALGLGLVMLRRRL